MIRLTDIHKEYQNGTKALKGVSLQIDDGEFVFLVGALRLREVHHHQTDYGGD